MSVNLRSERILSLLKAAKSLPDRPHISTLCRWWRRGVRGVKLETITIGGRRYTSAEALERFSAATTAAASSDPRVKDTPQQREGAIRVAEQELDRAGI